MLLQKKRVADLLFVVQIIGAFFLAGSQFIRFLHKTDGQTLSMLLLMEAFMFLHLALAISSHRHNPSRVTSQQVKTFVMWIVLIGSNIAAFWWSSGFRWNHNDSVTAVIALAGSVAVFGFSRALGRDWREPAPKGLVAILFKAWPQTMMAVNIAQFGNAGVPAIALIAGHVTVATRIFQGLMAVIENPREHNRLWLLASEILNELSWIAVTIVWLVS